MKKGRKKIEELAKCLPQTGKQETKSDVLGSYTGTDLYGEAPVQDADDL